jgi:hypothetical protein
MVKLLELAIAKAAQLPRAAQEEIGRELLERIASLSRLRADIDEGIRELDSGRGSALDIEEIIREVRASHGR